MSSGNSKCKESDCSFMLQMRTSVLGNWEGCSCLSSKVSKRLLASPLQSSPEPKAVGIWAKSYLRNKRDFLMLSAQHCLHILDDGTLEVSFPEEDREVRLA